MLAGVGSAWAKSETEIALWYGFDPLGYTSNLLQIPGESSPSQWLNIPRPETETPIHVPKTEQPATKIFT